MLLKIQMKKKRKEKHYKRRCYVTLCVSVNCALNSGEKPEWTDQMSCSYQHVFSTYIIKHTTTSFKLHPQPEEGSVGLLKRSHLARLWLRKSVCARARARVNACAYSTCVHICVSLWLVKKQETFSYFSSDTWKSGTGTTWVEQRRVRQGCTFRNSTEHQRVSVQDQHTQHTDSDRHVVGEYILTKSHSQRLWTWQE